MTNKELKNLEELLTKNSIDERVDQRIEQYVQSDIDARARKKLQIALGKI